MGLRLLIPCIAFLASGAGDLLSQNLSVVATVDGVSDLTVRIETIDRPHLVIRVADAPLLVFEVGNDTYGWFWSYVVPSYPFRDGVMERVGNQHPASLRIPLADIPQGVWRVRCGTYLGYTDTLTITVL